MRFKLTLEIEKRFGNVIPINYQYEQSAVIYKILSEANDDYAKWLHDNGFSIEDSGKRFKFFAYSNFKIEKKHVFKDSSRIAILSNTIEWQISFLPDKSTESFITGVFMNRSFYIGDKLSGVKLTVINIEVIHTPYYKEVMCFSTMSPMCLRCKIDENHQEYISPADERAKDAIMLGLLNRYKAFYNKEYEGNLFFDFKLLDEPKRKRITIKSGTDAQSYVIGYMCKFEISAPQEFIKIMYDSGIGELCSQGFGCVKLVEE
jgi:CRISPR-associated endoribonuclease Cas6